MTSELIYEQWDTGSFHLNDISWKLLINERVRMKVHVL